VLEWFILDWMRSVGVNLGLVRWDKICEIFISVLTLLVGHREKHPARKN